MLESNLIKIALLISGILMLIVVVTILKANGVTFDEVNWYFHSKRTLTM